MVSQCLYPFSSYVAAMFRLKPTLGQDTGPLSHRDQVFIRKAINDTREGVQKNDSSRQLCMNRAILDICALKKVLGMKRLQYSSEKYGPPSQLHQSPPHMYFS